MNVLFVHPNFPAQFRHIARLLAEEGHRVVFVTANARKDWRIPGVGRLIYRVPDKKTAGGAEQDVFHELRRQEQQAEAALRACMDLKKQGFTPHLIYGASGWGCTWFLRDLFPKARLAGYFEWFYNPDSADSRFGGHEPTLGNRVNLRLRNTVIVNDLLVCDLCITPSRWQQSQFPPALRERLTVLHDGIDADYFSPDPSPAEIPGLRLDGTVPLITYATRGMEPYRGFPQFIEAMGMVLAKHPQAHVVVAGEDRVCYGAPRADGKTWKEYMLSQVVLPPDRVHFVGSLPYGQYRALLRHSSVHVYLSRPFVLSWSLLESLSCGALVAASDTGPVQEVIRHRANGLLFDFFLPNNLARTVLRALDRQEKLRPLREAARQTILDRYALATLLPRLKGLLLGQAAQG